MTATTLARHPMHRVLGRFWELAGGRTRGRVIFLLACVLALDTADVSMIGAIAGKLETALRLSNTDLGLLAAVPSLAAVLATVPVGMITDRVGRVRLIAVSIVVWFAAMVVSGLAQSFAMLLVVRLALGAATATAGPPVASLVGDYFPARERARVYGLILSGELLGAGFGYVISGEFASGFSWRAAFFVLAIPSLAIAGALWRLLPEPPRGGAGQLRAGASGFADHDEGDGPELGLVQRKVEERDVPATSHLVLDQDPVRMSLWSATRYVLRVRTNVILIVTSALGYFYLTGVETFGLEYFRGQYRLSHATATALLALLGLGGVAGVVGGGRIADRLVRNGRLDGRILVGAISLLGAALLFLPALLTRSVILAMILYVAASAMFSARNPALDAARLDIMHHRLWGRAEAVRTVLRRLMVASAPIVFGFIADEVVSTRAHGGGQHGFGASASAPGLQAAFLILLVTLVVSGGLTLLARRTYPSDVASAVASEEALRTD